MDTAVILGFEGNCGAENQERVEETDLEHIEFEVSIGNPTGRIYFCLHGLSRHSITSLSSLCPFCSSLIIGYFFTVFRDRI